MMRPLPTSTLFPYTTLFRSPDDGLRAGVRVDAARPVAGAARVRSEEHTSELQSHSDLVCRLLLEKKKKRKKQKAELDVSDGLSWLLTQIPLTLREYSAAHIN